MPPLGVSPLYVPCPWRPPWEGVAACHTVRYTLTPLASVHAFSCVTRPPLCPSHATPLRNGGKEM